MMNPTKYSTLGRLLGAATALLILANCATPPEDPIERAAFEEANDPIEEINRDIFDFNLWIDRNILKPVAIGYRDVVPEQVRDSTDNFFKNVRTPIVLANDILQGESGRAAETLMRFFVNTTAGMGGLFDVAGEMGLFRHDEDFGQTLAVWGVPEGPYLMLPLLGPSTVRDAVGRAVDNAFDPLFWVGVLDEPSEAAKALDYYGPAETVVDGLNQRVAVLGVLEEVERTSIDFYAAIRSLYRQRRADEIKNQKSGEDVPAPSIISELE